MGARGACTGRAPAGLGRDLGLARRNTCGGWAALRDSRRRPLPAPQVRSPGWRPRLPAGRGGGAGAQGVASPPPGREPGRAGRGGAGGRRQCACACARGGAAAGRGECTKPSSRRVTTGSGEVQNASGKPNALKRRLAESAFLCKEVTSQLAGVGPSRVLSKNGSMMIPPGKCQRAPRKFTSLTRPAAAPPGSSRARPWESRGGRSLTFLVGPSLRYRGPPSPWRTQLTAAANACTAASAGWSLHACLAPRLRGTHPTPLPSGRTLSPQGWGYRPPHSASRPPSPPAWPAVHPQRALVRDSPYLQ